MGKTEAAEDPQQLNLRSVSPGIPKDPKERTHLEEDLVQIGCLGLLQQPWNLKDEDMVRELLEDQSSKWTRTVRALPAR